MNVNILSKIINPEAKAFISAFLIDRKINTDFYERIPDSKLDYRMVDTPERRSDSPRESLIHQIYVTRNYIYSVEDGVQDWSDERYRVLMKENYKSFSKTQLLAELKKTEQELIDLLSQDGIQDKKIKTPWSSVETPAITSLWGLRSHEILHTGWNLAVMDHLGIERFESIKSVWG